MPPPKAKGSPKRPPKKKKPRGTRPDEPGGREVSVTVRVNGRLKFIRRAVLKRRTPENHVYKVDQDDGTLVHPRNQNLKGLAKKLIDWGD